jgi:S1-C subfamily serine protease
MLKINIKNCQPIQMANSVSLIPPVNVMVLGNSLGVFPSLTMGKLSKRIGDSVLIIEGWLTPGNSGAPVLDENGRLLGMLAGRHLRPDEKSSDISCAALPVETIEAFYQKAFKSLKSNQTWVGLTVTDVKERSESGVVVVDVLPGGPAYQSRISIGDTIVSMNGAAIKNGQDLGEKVKNLEKKEEIELMIRRDNQSIPYHLKTKPLF